MATLALEHAFAVTSGDIETAIHLARQLGRPTLVSRVESLPALPDPLAFLHASSRELGHGVLWEQTAAGVAFAGAGIARAVTGDGVSRFGSVTSTIASLETLLVRDDQETFPLIGGFAFAAMGAESPIWRDFPDVMLVVPHVLIQIAHGAALVRATAHVDPDASPHDIAAALDSGLEQARTWARASLPETTARPSLIARCSLPERPSWESSVAAAVSLIRQDQLDKVVLAREERLFFDDDVSPVATLARLRDADPAATRFALQSASTWFIGSTPERLVRLQDGRVDVTCLAGSVAMGRDDEETRALATHLLASAKDREEHDIVLRSTIHDLREICEDVVPALDAPRVVKARSVQHLETPIVARMPNAGRVLDLVERLHPTPAVGGFPRDRAAAAIRDLEEFDRGWYAGPFGWTDLHGEGEFAVAIRSALMSGRAASLFAGGGIVAESVPAAEWDETVLKLRPMLAALGAA